MQFRRRTLRHNRGRQVNWLEDLVRNPIHVEDLLSAFWHLPLFAKNDQPQRFNTGLEFRCIKP